MCTVLLPQGDNPTAVNKYINHIIYHIIYHIISYIISYQLHYSHSITLTLGTILVTPPLTSMFLSRQDNFLVLSSLALSPACCCVVGGHATADLMQQKVVINNQIDLCWRRRYEVVKVSRRDKSLGKLPIMLCSLLRKTATVSECVSPKSLQDCLVNAALRPINLKTSQHRGATVNPAPFSPVPRLCKYFMHEPPYLTFVNNANLLVRFSAVRIAVPECLLCASSRQVVRLLRADIPQTARTVRG
jgi:hypothetical protein